MPNRCAFWGISILEHTQEIIICSAPGIQAVETYPAVLVYMDGVLFKDIPRFARHSLVIIQPHQETAPQERTRERSVSRVDPAPDDMARTG